MNKGNKKKLYSLLGIALGTVLLTGCTANFCSNVDKANIAYTYDMGVTVYVDSVDEIPEAYKNAGEGTGYWPVTINGEQSTRVFAYIPVGGQTLETSDTTKRVTTRYTAKKAEFLDSIIASAISNNYAVPTYTYYKAMDAKVLDAAVAEMNKELEPAQQVTAATITAEQINVFAVETIDGKNNWDTTSTEVNESSILLNYGYVKFYGTEDATTKERSEDLWKQWEAWNEEIAADIGEEQVPQKDFKTSYKSAVEAKLTNARSCISTKGGKFGHYGSGSNISVNVTQKTWKDAWKKGFFEGLIVYPVASLIDAIAYGIDPSLSGLGQVLSILIVTVIVRLLILAATFKSTLDQQKQQALQPQIAKIQAKYPNSNTNKDEAQRLQQEQMALYKRNKINPLSMLLTLVIQFPVFICVWGAMQGSSVLASGSVLNLRLSDTISSVLTNFSTGWATNATGWWTAAVLFVLMALFQVAAMMIPQWINKKKMKSIPKTSANPAQDKNGNSMKMMSWFMVIFTVIMGFALPAAMGLYWAVGALISLAQTLIMQAIMAKKKKVK